MTSFAAEPHTVLLQQQLDEITANTRALVQPERLAYTDRIVAELEGSGLAQNILAKGSQAPAFDLKAGNEKLVHSSDLLSLGPVILKFFRGRWDPYDMTELEAWESLQPALRRRRTLMVAISPQTPRQNAFTADRHGLSMPLLSDPACAYADLLRLAHTVPPDAQRYYRSMLVNIPFLNGDESWRLPLAATYVLAPDATVLYAHAFADHRQRPEPAEVVAALDQLPPSM